MEKIFITKKFNLLTLTTLLTFLLFFAIDIYLLIRGARGIFLRKVFLLEILILFSLAVVLLITFSQKIIIDDHYITQSYRGIFKFYKHTIPWKDIKKVAAEFGVFHIGEKITLYTSQSEMKFFDIIQERDRITIFNTTKDFNDLVSEVTRRARNAQLDERLKKFAATSK